MNLYVNKFYEYNCLWCHYINSFPEWLSFDCCWFFIERTTLYFPLLWCSYFDISFRLSCCLVPLPLLLAFLDILVKFYHPVYRIFSSYQRRVAVFRSTISSIVRPYLLYINLLLACCLAFDCCVCCCLCCPLWICGSFVFRIIPFRVSFSGGFWDFVEPHGW